MNDKTIQSRLIESFGKYGEQIAIQFDSRDIAYREIDKKSNNIANWIIEKSPKPIGFIGLFMKDRVEFITTLIGVIKAGCVFVPLDPTHPQSRLDLMIDTADIRLILCDTPHFGRAKKLHAIETGKTELVVLDTIYRDAQPSWSPKPPVVAYHPEDKIYIYFTSGTTGEPKAILGKNKSLLHFIEWEIDTFIHDGQFRCSQFTTPGFDAILRDILVPLLSGGTICIPGEMTMSEPAMLAQWIEHSQLNLIHCVPGLFRFLKSAPLNPDNFRNLKYIMLSGERVTPSDIESWYHIFDERIQLVNFYGPTETTMIKTFYLMGKKDIHMERIPIGQPMRGARLIIFDKNMCVCDEMAMGEIYIRTPYRTFGYYNAPGLNKKAFIPNPFNDNPDDLLYKTGDLGRLLPDGNYDLIGRIDRQVKIRGIRIELEAIENILRQSPLVEEAVVIKKNTAGENEILAAYIIQKQETPDAEEPLPGLLTRYLSGLVPDYMIPAQVIRLDKFPRKPNGKVDYEALVQLQEEQEADFIPPCGTIEKELAELWSDILGVEKIGSQSHFLKLGGNSLNIMTLISRIHRTFDLRVTLGEIFANPVLKDQAAVIGKASNDIQTIHTIHNIHNTHTHIPAIGESEYYEVSHAQKRVWLLCQFEDASLTFNIPSAFMIEGKLDRRAFTEALWTLIHRHESLRTIFIDIDGEPRQKILPALATGFQLEYLDIKDEEDPGSRVREALDLELAVSFDLARGPLLRAKLMALSDQKSVFIFTMHHIISDAISTNVFLRELITLYITFKGGNENPFPPLRIHYKDYTAWHNEQLQQEKIQEHKQFWLDQLRDMPLLQLPIDKGRPRTATYNGALLSTQVDETLTAQLRSLAAAHETTLFMVLLAALEILFYKYTDQTDIIIGIPTSGRDHVDLEGQIGFFINTIPLRARLQTDDTFIAHLEKVKTVTVKAFEHHIYPFDRLVHDLGGQRDPGRHPIFDVVLDMINYFHTENRLEESGLQVSSLEGTYNKSKFDLAIYIFEWKESLKINFEYKNDLFEQKTIATMMRRFRTLIGSITADPQCTVAALKWENELSFPIISPIAHVTTGSVRIPVSYHQERLWFIDTFEAGNLYPSSPIYHNIPLILKISGSLDIGQMEQSIRAVVKRHAILRTHIVTIDNTPFQEIGDTINLKWEVSHQSGPGFDPNSIEYAIAETQQPFLLEHDSLIRGKLFQLSDNRFILAITIHHIIADKYSLKIIAGEIWAHYQACLQGLEPQLPDLPLQYADFTYWQRHWPDELTEAMLFYWKKELRGKLQPLVLPLDRPRAPIHIFRAGRHSFNLPPVCIEKLRAFAEQEHLDTQILLLAAFEILLYRYSGQEEIVIGTSDENRRQPGTETMIGPLANLLVLRSFFSESITGRHLLNELLRITGNAAKYREIPFDKLVLALDPEKDMSRTALFDVLFYYEKNPHPVIKLKDLEIIWLETNLGWGKYDLNLLIQEYTDDNSFSGVMVYNADYYDSPSIARMMNHYRYLLESLLDNPANSVAFLDMLTDAEKDQALYHWNNTRANYPEEAVIQELFSEQVKKTPEQIALIYENRFLTYRALDEEADAIALYLIHNYQCRANQMAAVLLNRSEKLIMVLLGVLKAGAAYVPIDPHHPGNRINFILADSRCRLLITDEKSKNKVHEEFQQIAVDINSFDQVRHASFSPRVTNNPSDSAYVIYTSGTTGHPKGCLVSHRNVVRLLNNDRFPFDFDRHDVWIMAHSYCFDFSVWEMYGALLYGGRLVVPQAEEVRDPDRFLSLIEQYRVTVLNQTPAAFYALAAFERNNPVHHLNNHLRAVIFGGDRLEPGYLKEWYERYPVTAIPLINMYGITETTVHVTHFPVTGSDIQVNGSVSPIGKPLPETTLYIMNPRLRLQPVGVPGEIYVGGSGVAKGYLNRVELTAQRFIHNPYKPGEIIYRSGDLGRWLIDGNIEFKGRIDHQVKIRGFRIELGEIENHLLNYGGIKETVVIDKDAVPSERTGPLPDSEKYLCAYLVSESAIDFSQLRQYLAGRLPEYMIPAYFVKMDKIPLTHNGKIDRKKLPEPEIGTAGESQTAPRNKIQEILRDIWSEVLGLESGIIGIDANFFELGGHSIKATIMTARAHKELNVKIPLSEVFMTPTIRGLAEYIKSTSKTQFVAIRPVEKKECYPLSSAQKRLYQIHLMDSESLSYNVSSLLLLEGKLNIDKFEDIFQQLIRRHESFRTSFRLMNGSLVQWVKEDVFFQIQRFSREESRLERHAIMRFIRPFDLSQAPLLRIGIAPLQENKYLLLVDMHHIISDHISTQIIIKDITALYLGEKLPRLKLQYKDYSQWQESSHQSPEMKRQEEYWLKVFAGNIPVLDIATDYPRPSVRRFEGDHLVFFIENPLYAQLERLIRETGVTLYMFLLALCNILLWKYANQEDIIIGSPIMGRRHKDLEDIIGVFIGQLPMRNYPSGGKTFREFLAEVKQNALDAYENQEYPFEELTRQLGLQGNPARHPLFDVVFAIFNKSELAGKDGYLMELGDLRLSPYPFEDKTAKTDLRFEAAETGNRIRMTLTYSTALFKRSSAENITRRFMEILSHVVENSHIKLADIAVSHTRSMAKSTVHEDSAGDFGF